MRPPLFCSVARWRRVRPTMRAGRDLLLVLPQRSLVGLRSASRLCAFSGHLSIRFSDSVIDLQVGRYSERLVLSLGNTSIALQISFQSPSARPTASRNRSAARRAAKLRHRRGSAARCSPVHVDPGGISAQVEQRREPVVFIAI